MALYGEILTVKEICENAASQPVHDLQDGQAGQDSCL
jgi:hypothetical protein